LAMVRNLLRSREGPAPMVKSVALSHGFWHLGQFAIDYRATYGEMPSETLARARGAGRAAGHPRPARPPPTGTAPPTTTRDRRAPEREGPPPAGSE